MQLRDAMDVVNEILLREIAPSFSKITLIIRTGEERSIGKSFHIPLLDLNAAVLDEERILPLPLTIRESEDKKGINSLENLRSSSYFESPEVKID